MNIDDNLDLVKNLNDLILEKSEVLNTVNVAVNKFVTLKNEYIVSSNELRLNTDFKEVLGLSKAATEKQQQAYIDNVLKDLVQDVRIAEENVKSWKREVDLIDDKITLEKYHLKLLMNEEGNYAGC